MASDKKCIETMGSAQVWLCPASSKNMKVSIRNRFRFDNGDHEYSWAFSRRFRKKWVSMEVGSLCVFGNKKDGFTKAAYVVRKIDLDGVENWPFRSPSGLPWSWGFYLSEPFDIDIPASFFREHGRNAWQTQNLLTPEQAAAVRRRYL